MASGVIEPLVVFWNAWGIQAVVLLSFVLQVTLLVTAGLRRNRESRMLKFIVWTAYVLADTTAVYALGHMSVMCGLRRSPDEHGLMALWAPLLLVHLGGQDNITAYAIEDNQLWLRHLQNFGVQVVAAAYILYGSWVVLARRTRLVEAAAILVFVVGFLKYGERVWALMRASSSASSSLSATCYNKAHFSSVHQHKPSLDEVAPNRGWRYLDPSLVWPDSPFTAYALLDVPKQLFERPTLYVEVDLSYYVGGHFQAEVMLQVVRIQLQMMYDLLYTKAAVLHTWYGWCIRAISLPATVAALLLFRRFRAGADGQHHGQDGGGGRVHVDVDVAVTYVLLGGAVVLDTASLLRAVCSQWTYVHLRQGKWHNLVRVVGCLAGTGARLGKWACHVTSRNMGAVNMDMGQHSLSTICDRSSNSTSSKVARWMGREDWWDSRFHSWFTPVPELIIRKVVELVSRNEDITNSRGQHALHGPGLMTASEAERWTVELELDESILVWHIATQFYLAATRTSLSNPSDEVANAIEALSNYLFFLLAARPNMLPYPVSRQRYVQLCSDVIPRFRPMTAQLPAHELYLSMGHHDITNSTWTGGLALGTRLSQIPETESVDEVLLAVWVELLCYTAYRCNENSHAKHLSTGGELMTTVALFMLYKSRGLVTRNNNL